MVSEPLVLQKDYFVTKAADDAPNVLILYVLVLITCTSDINYGNGVSYMIVMVMIF